MNKHRPDNRKEKTKASPKNLNASIKKTYPGLQKVHKWKYKDNRCAHVH